MSAKAPDSDLLRFLKFPIYLSHEHPNRWEKYVYDEEFVHYPILALLLERSVEFRRSLFNEVDFGTEPRVVGPIPGTCPFDLKVMNYEGESVALIEVKTWGHLSEDQLQRQTAYLREQGKCRGYYILSGKQAPWGHRIAQESDGLSRSISFQAVLSALAVVPPTSEIARLAATYGQVLHHLNERTAEFDGDKALQRV